MLVREALCEKYVSLRSSSSLTQAAAGLAPPRWYAAKFTKVGQGESGSQGKNAKPLSKPLAFTLQNPN